MVLLAWLIQCSQPTEVFGLVANMYLDHQYITDILIFLILVIQ